MIASLLDPVLAGARDALRLACIRLALAALVAGMGLCMLVVGTSLQLAGSIGAQAAALLTGSSLLLLAALIALAARLRGRGRSARPSGPATIPADFPSLLIMAVLAGFAVGASAQPSSIAPAD